MKLSFISPTEVLLIALMSPINGIDKLPKQGLMKIAMTQNKIVENMTNLKLKKEKDNEKDISIVFLIDQVVCV